MRAAAGATLIDRLPIARVELIDVGEEDVAAAIERLSARDEVLYAEPNFIYRGAAIPNDERFEELWGLDNTGEEIQGLGRPDADIDATGAWDLSTGEQPVLVGVVDSGVAADHPDLAPNMWTNPGEAGPDQDNGLDDDENGFVDDFRGWDFVAGDNFPDDQNGHGTHVAGTIGARGDDAFGVAGVAWNVSLLPIRVLAANNSGSLADIASGMDYAGKMGADVANVSIQASSFSKLMRDAIAENPDTLYVIAAGNGGGDGASDNNDKTPTYPCAYPRANIVCVAATDQNDRLTDFSNYGTRTVDLSAPGLDVLSAQPVYATPMSEFFDGDDFESRWTTGGKKNTWGVATSMFGGALEDSPGKKYKGNTNSWAATEPPIDLSGVRNCRISYDLNLSVQGGDRLLIEGSADGTTWSVINSWHFPTHGWAYAIKDELGTSATGQDAYQIRFRLKTNAQRHADGASIDNVFLECTGSDYTSDSFAYYNGTSMAAPHVAGAAALAFSVAPDATALEIKEVLLAGVDVRPDLVGVVKSAGRLNINRTLAILTEPPGADGPEVVCVPGTAFTPSGTSTGTILSSTGAAVGEFTSSKLDDSAVFDEVDASFGSDGLHVVGVTGDDQIRYYDPSASRTTIEDLELVHSGVALGLRSDDVPVVGYHERLVADVGGVAHLCEANIVATGPGFDPQVSDVAPIMDGSFRSIDLAVDPSTDSIHRVFTRGLQRDLHYAVGSTSKQLGLKKVDGVRVAASNGAVVVGALVKRDLHLLSGSWTDSIVASGVRAWDVDIGPDGEPRAVWTNGKGKLRLLNGRRVIKLDWRATEVALAVGPDGMLHVAVGTAYPNCKGFGCWKVGYLQKAPGSPAAKTKLDGTTGYVTSLAIAVDPDEVAIVYGDPSSTGHLIVRRADY